MTKRRVVVTGLGMLSPLGLNSEDTWRKLLAGESGIGEITHFDCREYCDETDAFSQNPGDIISLKFKGLEIAAEKSA